MSYNANNIPIRSPAPYSDYELIDVDPHFFRVVGYFRPSDYGVWAASIAFFPAGLYVWERLEPVQGINKAPMKLPGSLLRQSLALGVIGGFFTAYIRSSKRFLGWTENAREVKMDRYEIKKALSEGRLPYHENLSRLDDRTKDVANRNSQYAFTLLAFIPWFNFAYHPYHGVDLNRYYVDRPGEEAWGFKLKPLDEIRAKYATHIE
ncbi:NUXM [[Candida] subhashii]|uniref:NUXM n=1 Tax=[Candida] subhashii TaxID=561895 RepID=A0A8J5QG18_9ASCO|nr:NUXM [[Candida] subhashii]KAG7663816.1 NUXM [[Candida] subhashii]